MTNPIGAAGCRCLAVAVVASCCPAPPARAQTTLFGGTSGNSPAGGQLGTVNQANADFTLRGDPTATGPLAGLAVNAAGEMYGTNNAGGGNSFLIRINPTTGQLLSTVGAILDSADDQALKVTDIAFQPGTGVLFAITGPDGGATEGNLYTIDLTTAEATLVGDTGLQRGGLAFAPDGTLYLASVGDDANAVPAVIAEIDPVTAAVIGTPQNLDMDGLAVRPTDSVIFGTGDDSSDLFTIDPTDGSQTLLGMTTPTAASPAWPSALTRSREHRRLLSRESGSLPCA